MSAGLHATLHDLGPMLALILFGFLPNEVWRLVGLMLVRGLDEKSQTHRLGAGGGDRDAGGRAGATDPVDVGPARRHPGQRADRRGCARLCCVPGRQTSVFAGVLTGEAAILLGTYFFGT